MKILLEYVGKHEFSFEIGENANGKQDGHNIWKKGISLNQYQENVNLLNFKCSEIFWEKSEIVNVYPIVDEK